MALCLAALCASAQSYEVRTLTFEDADYRGSGNVVGEMNWSSLIDNPEYNGSLLYGDGASTYMWYDEGNTELVWDGFEDSGMGQAFWSGGSAISNYYAEEFSQADYTRQLSIPLATSTSSRRAAPLPRTRSGGSCSAAATTAKICRPDRSARRRDCRAPITG